MDGLTNNGIIATISPGGKVTISMYEYEASSINHKGALIYELSSIATTINFGGVPYVINHDNIGPLAPYIMGDWISNKTKIAITALAGDSDEPINVSTLKNET